MANMYDSQGVATQMPTLGIGETGYQQTMGAGPRSGSGYLGTMGMSPEYNDQLFANIQGNINKNRMANRQGVMDNSSRFGMGAGQQQSLQQVNRDSADQSVSALSNAELQGAGMGREDRNKANDRYFSAEQMQQERILKGSMQEQMLGQDAWQFKANRTDAQNAQDQAMMMSILGIAGKGSTGK